MIVECLASRRAYHLVQFRKASDGACVTHWQVVAFHEIFCQHLPVCVPEMLFKEGFRIVCHVVTCDQICDFAQFLGNWLRIGVQGDKHPTQPIFANNVGQAVVIFAECLIAVHRWGATQAAIKIVSPCVVRTYNGSCVAAPMQKG